MPRTSCARRSRASAWRWSHPAWGPTDGLLLASGGVLTGHADFMNGWDQAALEQEVRLCLHRKVVCGITSGRKSG